MRQKTRLTPTSDVKKRETTEDEFLFSNKKKFDPSGRWKLERFSSEIKENLFPEHVTARTCFSILSVFVVFCICQPVVTFFYVRAWDSRAKRQVQVFFFFAHIVKNIPCNIILGWLKFLFILFDISAELDNVLQRREVELDHPALVDPRTKEVVVFSSCHGSRLFIVYSICFFGADAYQFLCVFVNDLGAYVVVFSSVRSRKCSHSGFRTMIYPFFDLRPLESNIFVGIFRFCIIFFILSCGQTQRKFCTCSLLKKIGLLREHLR